MESTQWHYAEGGEQRGPVSTEQLARMIAQGRVSSGDLVWREGMANWQAARDFPELIAQGAAGMPSSMPPIPVPVTPVQYGGYAAQGQSYNGTAVAAFVCSILGLVCCGVIFGIVAIILAQNALSGMARSGNEEGKGLATAARVIGIIGLVLWGIGTVVQLIMIFASAASGGRGGGFRF